MKHLEIYESLAEVQADITNNILVKPYIALYDNRHKVEFDDMTNSNIDYNSTELTFEILGNGTIGWKCSNSSIAKTIQYKLNNGEWSNITSTTSGVNINVSNGDKVRFKGNNTTYANSSYYNQFTSTCNFNVYGNSLKEITLPAITLVTRCYNEMFVGCLNLKKVTCYATSISANSCLYNWMSEVPSGGVFYKPLTMTSWPTGTSGIPSGWTIENI